MSPKVSVGMLVDTLFEVFEVECHVAIATVTQPRKTKQTFERHLCPEVCAARRKLYFIATKYYEVRIILSIFFIKATQKCVSGHCPPFTPIKTRQLTPRSTPTTDRDKLTV
jgi:hypothetical protein